jgi:prepilin-type N-terminal cleavage/methylation domain-containing protein
MVSRSSAVRSGFTLIEVIVATLISGLVVLGAHRILVQLADSSRHIGESTAESDRAANAERLLRTLVGRLDNSLEKSLVGDPQGARFTSWCDTPGGWLERCLVTVGIIPAPGSLALAATLPDGDVVVLKSGFQAGELRYLRAADHGGSWTDTWVSVITVPVAIGVVLDSDTMIVRIGERG